MRIREILSFIEPLMPPSLAFDWDNVGLLAGSSNWETEGAIFSLDVDSQAIQLAKENGFHLIITHHPVIFRPLKKVTDPLLLELLANRIAVISMHTNLDVSPIGVNFTLAEKLQLKNIRFLTNESGAKEILLRFPCTAIQAEEIQTYSEANSFQFFAENGWGECRCGLAQKAALKKRLASLLEIDFIEELLLQNAASGWGLGACGELAEAVSLETFAALVKNQLNCPVVQLVATPVQKQGQIRSVAVCGGSGASVYRSACQCDVFVTGEMGYHNVTEFSTPILEAGHFFTEFPILETLKKLINQKFPELKTIINLQPDYLQNLWIF